MLHLLEADEAHGEPGSKKMDVGRYLPLMLTEVRQHPYRAELRRDVHEMTWRPRYKMVFTWQCPIMFMSYSVCSYLAGLTIYVCTPLIRGNVWSAGSNVSSHWPVLDPNKISGMEHSANVLGDCGNVSCCLRCIRWNFYVLFVLDLSLCGP